MKIKGKVASIYGDGEIRVTIIETWKMDELHLGDCIICQGEEKSQ